MRTAIIIIIIIITNDELAFSWWKCESSFLKNMGRGCNVKASYGIFLQIDTKQPGVCVIAWGKEVMSCLSTFNTIKEEMQAKDERSALVGTKNTKVRVRNCAFLVADVTKNFALVTRISQLVASSRAIHFLGSQ